MLIHYNDNQLAAILASPALIAKHYARMSTSLINRMSELQSANCLADIPTVPPPRCRKLPDSSGRWAINLARGYHLVVEPSGSCDPNNAYTIQEITVNEIAN